MKGQNILCLRVCRNLSHHHRALSTFFESFSQTIEFGQGDRHVAIAAATFDIAIVESLFPLCRGAEVIIAEKSDVQHPARLSALIKTSKATSFQATPSYFRLMADDDCLNGIRVLCTGEPMPIDLGRILLKSASEVWNLYGPTETTIYASAHRLIDNMCDSLPSGWVCIGRPLPGYKMYVLDDTQQPVPVGVAGDLYISGGAVSRGYLNRPDLTGERFIPDPFAAPGSIMYRSGDIVRWRIDQSLDYLGRSDRQVKIRGHRIELAEIEAVLLANTGLKEAVVVTDELSTGVVRLIAYVVTKVGEKISPPELLGIARQHLPEFMVPSTIIQLDALPLTTHGKIDRRALPKADLLRSQTRRLARGVLEETLCKAFTEVTGVADISLDDSFFGLGGDSIMGIRLSSRIHDRLDVEVPLEMLFETQTIGDIAAWITETIASRDP